MITWEGVQQVLLIVGAAIVGVVLSHQGWSMGATLVFLTGMVMIMVGVED